MGPTGYSPQHVPRPRAVVVPSEGGGGGGGGGRRRGGRGGGVCRGRSNEAECNGDGKCAWSGEDKTCKKKLEGGEGACAKLKDKAKCDENDKCFFSDADKVCKRKSGGVAPAGGAPKGGAPANDGPLANSCNGLKRTPCKELEKEKTCKYHTACGCVPFKCGCGDEKCIKEGTGTSKANEGTVSPKAGDGGASKVVAGTKAEGGVSKVVIGTVELSTAAEEAGPGAEEEGWGTCIAHSVSCKALGVIENLCGTCRKIPGGFMLYNGGGIRFEGRTFDDDNSGPGQLQAQNVCNLAMYGNQGLYGVRGAPTDKSHAVLGPKTLQKPHWYGSCEQGGGCGACTNDKGMFAGEDWTRFAHGDTCKGDADLDVAWVGVKCYVPRH